MKKVLLAAVVFLVLVFWLMAEDATKPVHGLQVANMDTAMLPCQDFYQYANGTWLKTQSIPKEYPRWGAFMEILESNTTRLKGILDELSSRADWPKGSIEQKVADFVASGMDEAAIEKAGLNSLAARLARIGNIRSVAELASEIGLMHLDGGNPAFFFYIGQDDKNTAAYIGQFYQGGLGLPDRDYYTKDDEQSKVLREKYVGHVARMFELMGESQQQAKQSAATVMSMETRLAKSSLTLVEQRDPQAIYHKYELPRLDQEFPGFPWQAYNAAIGLPYTEKSVLVRQPTFFKELGLITQSVPLGDWQTYLRWHLIHGNASLLSLAFVKEHFDFFNKTLQGVAEMRPRWKRVLRQAEFSLGDAIGRLFVEKYFGGNAKQRALELVANLRAVLRERLQTLEWLSAPTRQKALLKLDAFKVKIGYPDKWRDYAALALDRGPYVMNVLRANTFEFQRNLAKLGQPIDRTEWGMNAHEVNAYYDPNLNEICFPAGILQPPFFDAEADDACNYGGIGTVIGHEMTHGFDDQGRQFDADGNLNDWWTAEDAQAYATRQDKLVKQFNAYMPFPDQAINGKLTLGENIGDLGGLKISFAALQKALTGKSRILIDGFTPAQRFFINYAQCWRSLASPEFLRMQINTDPHSPAKFRVLGPLANLPEFQEAFRCAAGTPMILAEKDRTTIW